MTESEIRHLKLTKVRDRALSTLFGQKATSVYPVETFTSDPESFLIDVVLYPIKVAGTPGPVVAAVTNGMSDHPMTDPATGSTVRHELIQYFRECDEPHARRLYEMAWLPLFDNFLLEPGDTITWPDPVVPGSPWKNSLFLTPMLASHRSFQARVGGGPMTLLWHVPVSDAELNYKKRNGSDALIARMDAVKLPWIFDETNRPPLVP
jgi:hypothetical protein